MHHELREVDTAEALAVIGADIVADSVARVLTERARVTIAVSGGVTPQAMFEELATRDLPWSRVTMYQVDERVAPDGDASRNLTSLRDAFGGTSATILPMDVTNPDLDSAATAYGAQLPSRFDLVHLGLGADGHTASLVPGDPVLDERDRLVAVTAPYLGHRRLTLTYPALARADQLLWLVSGAEKQHALTLLREASPTIPAGLVRARHSVIVATSSALAT